jgi:hypothetical protein
VGVLADFFKGSETRLGIFDPHHYLIALFPDQAAARKAERSLLDAGFRDDQVVAAPGEQVVELVREHARNAGLVALVMQGLSRMFETEEVYADHDFKLCSRGAGSLAVYAPSQSRKQHAWKLIRPAGPIVARHYSLGGVEHLAGET